MRRAWVFAFLLCGCSSRHQSSEDECAAIFDQLVALQLRQTGFRDPVLEKARADELRPLLAPELAACRRLEFKESTVACARKATSARDLAHDCLR